MRQILTQYEPAFALILADTLLAARLAGRWDVAQHLPPSPPSDRLTLAMPSPDDENLHFPIIETATAGMANREVLFPWEYYQLDSDARQKAFTVSNVAAAETMQKIQQALVEDIAEGGTLRQFRDKVIEALDSSWLSPSQVETVYRTAVGSEYAQAQHEMHEQVEDAFPFVLDASIADGRRSPLCEIMSKSGIQGTNIYLFRDPEWQRLRPLRHFNCRCGKVPLSVEDAARRGIRYAQEWLRAGRRPVNPPFVARINAELPKGWTR